MPQGFSSLDYFVVAACVAFTVIALATRPRWMLYALPTLLTIYFFVPIVTLLTPWQIVPLMLGVWLIGTGQLSHLTKYNGWLALFLIAVLVALFAALFMDDAGTRPILRLLHYVSLFFTFAFVVATVRDEGALRAAMWGLAIAGLVHAGYASYQLLAFEIGLPFRAIVRGAGGDYDVASIFGLLRVNGLASEPKRLAFVLFTGFVTSFYLAQGIKREALKLGLRLAGVISLVLSTLTLSGSYFAALALLFAIVGVMSPRFIKFVVIAAVPMLLTELYFPDRVSELSDRMFFSVSERLEEANQGLEADNIYRQEFYAQDFVLNEPFSMVSGVGLGRYNRVLNDRYGVHVGYSPEGGIVPLNSQIFEIGFDLGLPGLIVWFGGCVAAALSIGRKRRIEFSLFVIIAFLTLQSLFIANLAFSAFPLGISAAYLKIKKRTNGQRSFRQTVPRRPRAQFTR